MPTPFSLFDYCQANSQGAVVEIGLHDAPKGVAPTPALLVEAVGSWYRRAGNPAKWISSRRVDGAVASLQTNMLQWVYDGNFHVHVNGWFAIATIGSYQTVFAYDWLEAGRYLTAADRNFSLTLRLESRRNVG